jgi:hypothetical protein
MNSFASTAVSGGSARRSPTNLRYTSQLDKIASHERIPEEEFDDFNAISTPLDESRPHFNSPEVQ